MKLAILLFTLFAVTQNANCRCASWIAYEELVEKIINKTSQVSDYVVEKGRNIKKFYNDNIRDKFKSVLDKEESEIRRESENGPIRSFTEYVTEAITTEQRVFDVIAPIESKYRCNNDDPAVNMNTPQLIASHGYPSESHTIMTEDGYILTAHRIPYSKHAIEKTAPRRTVLLHHGLLGSSADWVLSGPEKGLAYILSEAGYDVWMANVRGNTYSRSHILYPTNSYAFWNFTFHEVSQHDLPATIDYIMNLKGWDAKINYIGHSMGTTVLFALLSTKTQYNKILRAGLALAPVAYMANVKSPIRILARFAKDIEYLTKILGANEFLPQNSVLRWLSKHACEINHYEEAICENSLFVLCGHDAKQFNRTLLPIILSHTPAGASTKTLIHYAQEIRNDGSFQQFDYGAKGNLKQYGSVTPPEYHLSNITLPIALISAQNDWLASDLDVKRLYNQLGNAINHYVVPLKEFNHVDFLWAIDAPNLVYKKLLSLMENIPTRTFLSSLENDIKSDLNINF